LDNWISSLRKLAFHIWFSEYSNSHFLFGFTIVFTIFYWVLHYYTVSHFTSGFQNVSNPHFLFRFTIVPPFSIGLLHYYTDSHLLSGFQVKIGYLCFKLMSVNIVIHVSYAELFMFVLDFISLDFVRMLTNIIVLWFLFVILVYIDSHHFIGFQLQIGSHHFIGFQL
jgi:hypothetical protein